ncbi:MAG: polysaccharide pyruvyl transferase family protein [Ruminococcus sp.]
MSEKPIVAYLTRHTVSNYGSVLQAFATQTALEKLGCNPVCINYYRSDEKPKELVHTLLQCSKWNKNALTRLVYMLTQKPVYSYAGKRFEQYRKIVKVTDREYNCEQDLIDDCPEADVYMTGSDQVWNTITCDKIDPVYFMSFLKDGQKRFSYAASFGGSEVKDKDKPVISNLLKKYDSVSIRENSGVRIAEELGINASQVLDPTLLLTKDEWDKIIPKRECSEKYVLVYQLHPNKNFDKYAKAFAKSKGLKLYRISQCFHHTVRSGKFICCPPVEEFLWYIKNAEYFLTDSFHGTAFAIGLNTQFVDILPKSYSERISSILELIGCENRILKSYDDFSITDNRIDFDEVNRKIETERQKSYDTLRNMIGECLE